MASTISAGTTSGTALNMSADTTGNLVFTTGGANTTALTIDSSQNITTAQRFAKASMPTGSVLQVVNATYATIGSSVSATFADTGLSATITPISASNKILCIVNINGCSAYTTTTGLALRLVRTSTTIITFDSIAAYASTGLNLAVGSTSTSYLDSPATTSATTYKIQFSNASAAGTVYFNNYLIASGTVSTITLMEVAG